MTEPFDPYRKWLGIPAQDRPPHHYRLLGIEPFESDQEVICNAADARMAQIKTFQTGKHSDHSQRLLNELAAAKVCLLNPAKKAEYDQELREGRGARDEGRGGNAPGLRSGGEDADDLEEVSPVVVVSAKPSDYLARRRRKRQPTWLMPSIMFGVVVLLAVVLALAFQEIVADRHGTKRSGVAEKERPPVPSKSVPPAVAKKPSEPVRPLPEPEPREEPKPAPPKSPPAEEEQPAPPVIHKPVEPQRPEPARPKPPVRRPPSARKKPPVPDAAAQREAESEIRSLFSKEFAAADNARRKLALSATLQKQARGTKNDPAARFVLYRLAGELAAEAGYLARGFAVIDRLAGSYDVNPLTMKADLAAVVVPSYRVGANNINSFVNLWIQTETLMVLADLAARKDDFPTAVRAAKLAVSMARATKNTRFLRETVAQSRELEHMRSRFRPVETALGVLVENPDDAKSNLTAGKWRCFTNGDWDRGLPLMAKGNDVALAELAHRDLARPKTVEDQLALAEDWFAAAAKETSPSKPGLQVRASYWYEKALPKLSGLEKTKVKKRLDDLHEKDIRGTRIRGLVVKGNVALARNRTTVRGVTNHSECLLDGNSAARESGNAAFGKWPCRWIIEFDRVYSLREIRFRLYDYDRRAYRYVLSVSGDGNHYTVVKDASQGGWSSWQQVLFSPRPVKTIMLEGLHNTKTKNFAIVELEAYCIPSKGM